MKKLVPTALILSLVVLVPICCLAHVGYSVIAYKRPLEPVLQILGSQFPIPSEAELVKEWNRKISIAQYRAAPFVLRNSVEWRKFILLKMEDNETNRQRIESWTFYVELANIYKDHINTAWFQTCWNAGWLLVVLRYNLAWRQVRYIPKMNPNLLSTFENVIGCFTNPQTLSMQS